MGEISKISWDNLAAHSSGTLQPSILGQCDENAVEIPGTSADLQYARIAVGLGIVHIPANRCSGSVTDHRRTQCTVCMARCGLSDEPTERLRFIRWLQEVAPTETLDSFEQVVRSDQLAAEFCFRRGNCSKRQFRKQRIGQVKCRRQYLRCRSEYRILPAGFQTVA